MKRSRAALAIGGIGVGLVGVAGLLKAADLESFEAALRGWFLVPGLVRGAAAFVVPALEIGLALAWFLAVRRRLMGLLVVGLLASFSGLYGLHLALGEAPDCGCFGTLVAFERGRDQAWWLFVRNGVLAGLVLIGVVWGADARSGRGATMAEADGAAPAGV